RRQGASDPGRVRVVGDALLPAAQRADRRASGDGCRPAAGAPPPAPARRPPPSPPRAPGRLGVNAESAPRLPKETRGAGPAGRRASLGGSEGCGLLVSQREPAESSTLHGVARKRSRRDGTYLTASNIGLAIAAAACVA